MASSSDTEPPSPVADNTTCKAAAAATTNPSSSWPQYTLEHHTWYVAQVASHLGAAKMAGDFAAAMEAKLNADERFPAASFVTFTFFPSVIYMSIANAMCTL